MLLQRMAIVDKVQNSTFRRYAASTKRSDGFINEGQPPGGQRPAFEK